MQGAGIDGRTRVIIERVWPEIDDKWLPPKDAPGEAGTAVA